MPERRVTKVVVQVEWKYPPERRVTKVVAQVEYKPVPVVGPLLQTT